MDIDTWVALAALVLAVVSALAGMIWALARSISKQFDDLSTSQTENHHKTDVRLTGIEKTVGPYDPAIKKLESQQSKNVIDITRLQSNQDAMGLKQESHQRQIESLQQKR